MQRIQIFKYPSELVAISRLNHLDDALDFVSFLTAEDFVSSQLNELHNKSKADSKELAKRIASHANLAKDYANLSISSKPEISFLPGYYAILNLAKIFCLAGQYSNEFDRQTKWHGATYNPRKKSSQSLLTEEVCVRTGGTLALFYRTLTDQLIKKDRVFQIKQICEYIPGISSELSVLTGEIYLPVTFEFYAEVVKSKLHMQAHAFQTMPNNGNTLLPFTGKVNELPCLKGFRKKKGSSNIFEKSAPFTSGCSIEDVARSLITPMLLDNKLFPGEQPRTHVNKNPIPIPEEFAAALIFFHISSVCRYNPEFLYKLTKSAAWPMLLQARRHALFGFLISTWSFIIQREYLLVK